MTREMPPAAARLARRRRLGVQARPDRCEPPGRCIGQPAASDQGPATRRPRRRVDAHVAEPDRKEPIVCASVRARASVSSHSAPSSLDEREDEDRRVGVGFGRKDSGRRDAGCVEPVGQGDGSAELGGASGPFESFDDDTPAVLKGDELGVMGKSPTKRRRMLTPGAKDPGARRGMPVYRGRRATGITRRSAVCVAENDATLLSTSPAALAASMTSTSRRVAALPLRDTTQIAPFGRIRVASSSSGARASVESAPRSTTSVSV